MEIKETIVTAFEAAVNALSSAKTNEHIDLIVGQWSKYMDSIANILDWSSFPQEIEGYTADLVERAEECKKHFADTLRIQRVNKASQAFLSNLGNLVKEFRGDVE